MFVTCDSTGRSTEKLGFADIVEIFKLHYGNTMAMYLRHEYRCFHCK